jgi:hypothetical protein
MILLPKKYKGWPPATLVHEGKEWDRVNVSRIYRLIKDEERKYLDNGVHDTVIVKIESVPKANWEPLKNYKNAYVLYITRVNDRSP